MPRLLSLSALSLILAACGPADQGPAAPDPGAAESTAAETTPTAAPLTLQSVLEGSWRSDAERARDVWRHPAETLEFFGVEPDDTVIELWPGGGWYSNILAPYLASGGGQLIASHWSLVEAEGARRERLENIIETYHANYADTDQFGTVGRSAFPAEEGRLSAPGTADVVLTFRNLHNWMAQDYAMDFFNQAYAALKPGGVLGVVEHRLPSTAEQDPRAASGYVHEDMVKALAAAAGFEFVAASQVNANPKDTADHPFGVWTLPPVSRTTTREGETPDGFDPAVYLAIGESDRMTLKFMKPQPEDDDEPPAETGAAD